MQFKNKKTKSTINIPTTPLLYQDAEEPRGTVPHGKFERFPKKDLPQEVQDHITSMTGIPCKTILLHTIMGMIPNGLMIIPSTATWEDLRTIVLNIVHKMELDNPEEISDIAYGPRPCLIPNHSLVVDTTSSSPCEAFPDFSIVYINMFRRPIGWNPIAVGYRACDGCGSMKEPLKRCGGCKQVYYCSRACQQKAWKDHKTECKC